MIKSILTPALGRRFWTGFALLGTLLWLAACQPESTIRPASQARVDSTATMDDDPPVKPDGPGGGK